MSRRTLSKALVLAGLLTVVTTAGADLSEEQAEAFTMKLRMIGAGADGTAPRQTAVTEEELNSWFEFRAIPMLPDSVAEPRLTMHGEGRLSGRILVDLSAVTGGRAPSGPLDPLALFKGRVPVVVTGTLTTADGVGRFLLEAAEVSGLPLPPFLLQELVSYYSRTTEQPRGVRLDDPFELPAGIQRIDIAPGQANVIQ
ncbi:MAG: hypothetical protein FJW23_08810 [Acidimicrobiia bacterium]|nr:hypothetical protein [Acidimicrobiia bacterium]